MRLLHEQHDDLPRFYAAARQLAEQPREERHAASQGGTANR